MPSRPLSKYILSSIFLIGSNFASSSDEFTYDVIDGGAEITGCVGECPSDLVIPEEIDGYSATSIGDEAFWGDRFNSVIIPDSVTSIGVNAFLGSRLETIEIPDSVTSIGAFAFDSNRLTSLVIPESISTIEMYSFVYNRLTNLTIPDTVTIISEGAFGSNQLTSVTIPHRVNIIGYGAFYTNQLTSITFLGDRPEIGEVAFNSNLLETIYYCDYADDWPGEVIEGVTPQLDENCDSDNDGVKNTQDAFPFDPSETLDTDLDGIGNNTDPDDDNDGVLDEDDFAPLDNTIDATDGMLTYDIINDEIEITGCLEDCPSDLIIPEIINGYSVTSIKDSSFSYEELIDTVTLPQSIVSIGYGAFSFNNIENVTIPSSVTSVGNTAFNANQLDIIRFSGNRPVIHPAAFSENQIQNIYYCSGTTGWPGEAIEGVMPQLDENCEPNTLNSYSVLDVDQNGSFDALTDGLILIRYAYGFRGDALVSGVIASDAERTTAGEIEAHIQTLLP